MNQQRRVEVDHAVGRTFIRIPRALLLETATGEVPRGCLSIFVVILNMQVSRVTVFSSASILYLPIAEYQGKRREMPRILTLKEDCGKSIDTWPLLIAGYKLNQPGLTKFDDFGSETSCAC